MNDKQLICAAVPLLVDWCAAVRRPLPWRRVKISEESIHKKRNA